MGFTKLLNPKPTPAAPPPDGVAVSCRELKRQAKGGKAASVTRFAVVRIGGPIARRAGWNGSGRADVVIGDGLERLRCGIAIAGKGEFKLSKLKTGDYQLTITERAADGLLRLGGPRFSARCDLVPIVDGSPPCVMFDLPPEMRLP